MITIDKVPTAALVDAIVDRLIEFRRASGGMVSLSTLLDAPTLEELPDNFTLGHAVGELERRHADVPISAALYEQFRRNGGAA